MFYSPPAVINIPACVSTCYLWQILSSVQSLSHTEALTDSAATGELRHELDADLCSGLQYWSTDTASLSASQAHMTVSRLRQDLRCCCWWPMVIDDSQSARRLANSLSLALRLLGCHHQASNTTITCHRHSQELGFGINQEWTLRPKVESGVR